MARCNSKSPEHSIRDRTTGPQHLEGHREFPAWLLLYHHESGQLSRRTGTFASCTAIIEKNIFNREKKETNNLLYTPKRSYGEIKVQEITESHKVTWNCLNVTDVNYETKIRFDLMPRRV